jgi:2-polyprenyl-3-methyl-5-hydroxy-6-metoxy-1,4-benzoquinol methylase
MIGVTGAPGDIESFRQRQIPGTSFDNVPGRSLLCPDRCGTVADQRCSHDVWAAGSPVPAAVDDGAAAFSAEGPSAEFALERFTPGSFGPKSAYEHWTRYLLADRYVGDRDVLDYGCGTGYGAQHLADTARDVLAVDVSQAAVDWARAHHPHPRCRFERSAALPTDLPSASRDVVVCFEVIEHLLPQDELLREFARILRPGGVLLVSTPDPAYTATLGDNPFHVRELDRAQFESLVGAHFAHRQVYVQTTLIGAGLAPDGHDGSERHAGMRVMTFDGACNEWRVGSGLTGPIEAYVIVASDGVLAPPVGCLMADRDGRLLADALGYVERLERERATLTAALEAVRSQAADAARDADAARARGASLEQSLAQTQASEAEARGLLDAERLAHAAVAGELASTRDTLDRTSEDLDGARAALAQSEGDLLQLRHDVIYLERKVGLRWVEWAGRGTLRVARRVLGGR